MQQIMPKTKLTQERMGGTGAFENLAMPKGCGSFDPPCRDVGGFDKVFKSQPKVIIAT